MKVKFEGGGELEAALKGLDISAARKRAWRARHWNAQPSRSATNGKPVSMFFRRSEARHQDRESRANQGNPQIPPRRRGKHRERFVGIDASEGEDLAIYSVIEELGNEGQPPAFVAPTPTGPRLSRCAMRSSPASSPRRSKTTPSSCARRA